MMELVIISHKDVEEMLSFPECIGVLEDAFTKAGRGVALTPPRTPLVISPDRVFGAMATYVEGLSRVGIKVNTVFSTNSGSRFHIHQGAILVFETENGCLEGIVEAAAITNIRTAAASALATRLLTEECQMRLAIIGAGTQGMQHLLAMRAVRTLTDITIWDISAERAEAAAKWAQAKTGLDARAAKTVEEAAACDLICICTPSASPVLLGEWVRPGTHINSVGFSGPRGRELDNALLKKSKLYVDWLETIKRDCGDIILPLAEGAISDKDILGDFGDMLAGRAVMRGASDDITLYKATGVAIEDIACADFLMRKARREGRGVRMEFGGFNN